MSSFNDLLSEVKKGVEMAKRCQTCGGDAGVRPRNDGVRRCGQCEFERQSRERLNAKRRKIGLPERPTPDSSKEK